MNRVSSRSIFFVLKLVITIALIAYLFVKVDMVPVLEQIGAMQPLWAAMVVAVMALQLFLVSLRWRLVNQLVDARMNLGQVLRLTLIGQFFNQILPSAMGGDAVRAWLASRDGIPLGRAVTGIVCDRAVALVVLVLMISIALVALPSRSAAQLPGGNVFRLAALLAFFGLASLFFLGGWFAQQSDHYRMTRKIGRMVGDLRTVLYSRAWSLAIVGLAAAVQMMILLAIYLCAKAMNIRLDFLAGLLVIPSIMLVSMIPISFAGWGVREGAMVVGLGLLGIAATDALSISVAFGFSQIIIGLPGGLLWLLRRGASRVAVVRPG